MSEPYVTREQLAEHFGITPAHVSNLLHRGLPSVKVGRCRRFQVSKVEAWLTGSEVAA